MQMFNIKIDEELMATLAHMGVRLEELFIIVCLTLDQLIHLRAYLKTKNHDQLSAYMQPLERKLLVKKLVQAEEFSWDNYELTDFADQVFDVCSDHIIEGNSLMREKIVPNDSLVKDFLELFPEGVRNKGGEYLRTHKEDIASKMKTFVNKYKYTPEVILGATARYLDQQRRDQYGWCSAAHYFISKNGISKLAAECESYKTNPGPLASEDWQTNLM